MSITDFIEIYPNAVSPEVCAQIVARFEADQDKGPGRVGSGVFPELKDSRDLMLQGKAHWQDVEHLLMGAALKATVDYLRRYPHLLIAPLMLKMGNPPRQLTEQDILDMPQERITALVQTMLRPGAVNLQRYTADQGGYPYWHCELYPRDPDCETLHRHLLWTVYLNDEFSEGETEFLYQQRKVKPRTGDLLLAPAAFTHTRRGNMPRGGDKYIATSWILMQRAEVLFPQQ